MSKVMFSYGNAKYKNKMYTTITDYVWVIDQACSVKMAGY